MGGCRCTFRNCESSSLSNPGMHFFHFPFRNAERCEKWALYSNNLCFLQLPINKLRNKVICEEHFKDECFMNIRKERLTKWAIPTILKLTSGEIIDFEFNESNKTIYNVQANKNCNYDGTLAKGDVKTLENSAVIATAITIADDSLKQESIGNFIAPSSTVSKNTISDNKSTELHLDMQQQLYFDNVTEYRLIDNDNGISSAAQSTPLPQQPYNSPNEKSIPILLNGSTNTKAIPQSLISIKGIKRINNKPIIRKRPIAKMMKNVKLEIRKGMTKNEFLIDPTNTENMENLQTIEILDDPEIEDKSTEYDFEEFNKSIEKKDEDIKMLASLNEEQTKEINKLKELLTEKMSTIANLETTVQSQQAELNQIQRNKCTPFVPQKVKSEKLVMSKPVLFNGVRRYLNPSMVSLLRMELFGDPERPYKPDERQFSMELLNLSDSNERSGGCSSIYDYMRSEWRFRLPPKSNVQQWIKEKEDNGESDTIDWDDC